MTTPPGDRGPTLDEALRAAMGDGVERLDAQRLLADLLGRNRSWLVAHGDERLDTEQHLAWREQVRRCAAGEPLAYLLGRQEFFGLELQVGPSVLVPRADTETLVDWALEILQAREPAATSPWVVDLGTGSGAIALAIRRAHPSAQVTAVDASSAALRIAQANGERLGLKVGWRTGDWWSACDAATRFDLAVANPPYIAAGDPHLEALRHEPINALVSGDDGLDALRRIVAGASDRLAVGGWLLLEHGHEQAGQVFELLSSAGFVQIETRRDLAGRPRCTGGKAGLKPS
jgi:release factor glutamine methyltransferase